jgi:hypothetical protein
LKREFPRANPGWAFILVILGVEGRLIFLDLSKYAANKDIARNPNAKNKKRCPWRLSFSPDLLFHENAEPNTMKMQHSKNDGLTIHSTTGEYII